MNKLLLFAKNHKKFTLYTIFVIVVICTAIFAPLIAPYNPVKVNLKEAELGPSLEHLMGTDALGRDVFSRIIYGGRTSIASSLTLVLLISSIGTFLGMLAGFFSGIVDTIIMRAADIMISFPDLILAIAIVGILGPNMINVVIAITVVGWPKYARLTRSMVLKIKESDYIEAAKVTGSKTFYIFRAYILPNILPLLIVTMATDIGAMMLQLAAMSFLGFGAQPPTPEWGYMLSEGRDSLQAAPWLLIFPGVAIFIVVMAFNLLGDSLRDIMDPRNKK